MVGYYASSAYQQLIVEVCTDCAAVITKEECKEDLYLSDANTNEFRTLETLIIDLNGIKDEDKDIISFLNDLKITNDKVRIIILAPYREPGDKLLSKLFALGVRNFITTKDFIEIKEELKKCITVGKSYNESVIYKDAISESKKIYVKEIDRVSIAIAGTQKRIGVTHNSITLANYLRNAGYICALVEKNDSKDFESIRESYDLKAEKGYFTMNGIDYYTDSSSDNLVKKTYNFIIYDCGCFKDTDSNFFNSCDKQLIIAGVKAWEQLNFQKLLDNIDFEKIMKYYYYFNLCPKAMETDVRKEMNDVKDRVFFTHYAEDPFFTNAFKGMDVVIKEYLPEPGKVEKQKKKKGK